MKTDTKFYWDCDCKTQFIHLNIHRLRCPLCNVLESDAPEASIYEVANPDNLFRPTKLINTSKQVDTAQEHPIKSLEDMILIESAFDAWNGWYDEENCHWSYDDSQTQEGSILVGGGLYEEIVTILTNPVERKELLELITDAESSKEIIFEQGTAEAWKSENQQAEPNSDTAHDLPHLTDDQLEALQSGLTEALTNYIGETNIAVKNANPDSQTYDIAITLDVKTLAKLISK